MSNLEWYQYVLIGLVFVWSGFVRSGLGFGGAVLALPFLLLIVDDPVIFLPLIAVHLLVFSGLIMWQSHHRKASGGETAASQTNIDWPFLRKAIKVMIVPKLLGVVGLLTLPPKLMSTIIFMIVLAYAVGYIVNRPIRNKSRIIDNALLATGGYFSGISLTGAPLVIPVFAAHVSKHQLRDTLFVLWFFLTSIKLVSFIVVGVDLQLIHHLWLLPCAWVGHVMGNRMHQRILAAETPLFFRLLGVALILVSGVGLWRVLA
jgi:uncharacterized protein